MFLNFFKKKKTLEWAILALIIVLAFVIRFWNFDSWLCFEADQSRDANIVKAALENGPGYLPLLGPRAAGTFLRLGPIEYYFQYLSAVLFNSTEPFVLAYPALLFSVLSILVFYWLIKNFFSRPISLMITAVYAFSFILIQYARFAWNPNGIPFWGLLFILSLYKAYSKENRKRAGLWLLLGAFSYGVVSQLHFIALVGFPLVAGLFWIFYFPKKIKLYFWAGAIGLVLLNYVPMFLSETSTDWDNVKQFKYALTVKATGDKTVGAKEKIQNDLRQIMIAFSMFTTSFGHKDSRVSFYFGAGLFLSGFLWVFWLAKKDKKRRLLAWLLFCWMGVFIFLYLKTESSLKPRFFFPIAAVPFFLLAYLLDFFVAFNKRKKIGYVLAFCLSFFLIWANLDAVKQWYGFLTKADDGQISRKMSLKQDNGVTLESLKAVAGYMAEVAKKNQKTICYDGMEEFKRSVEYILKVEYPESKRTRISNGMKDEEKQSCQFFSFAQKKTNRIKMSGDNSRYFQGKLVFTSGVLAVWSLEPKEEFYSGEKIVLEEVATPEIEVEASVDSDNEADSLSDEEISSETIQEESGADEIKPPRRVERVFWKDVF